MAIVQATKLIKKIMAYSSVIAKANRSQKGSSLSKKQCSFFEPVIQPKLAINQPNDVYEQEADTVADSIMRMTDIDATRGTFSQPSATRIQRKCKECEEEEKQRLNRKEVNNDETIADASTQKYVSSLNDQGRSLTQRERSFFEPRFGYDFSDVQLHTNTEANQSAKKINALAYTYSNHIVFGANQYQPENESGKRLLAHELTHVVQQNSDSIARNKIQKTPVTSGEYGVELEHYVTLHSVPAQVTALLRRSRTYMNMAHTLDRHYIALDGTRIRFDWAAAWSPNNDGVLTAGPFTGRRVLAVWWGSSGSEFLPAGTLDNDFGYDIILLQPPNAFSGDQTIGEWIQIIAHETTHAFTRNTSGGTASASAVDRITAAITDEVNTRITESTIVTEATRGSRLPAYTSTTGSTNPAQVQRDMFPSALKRTYLEQFVFDELIREAITSEGLSQTDIERHNARVDALTVGDADRVVQSPGFILYFDPAINLYNTFNSQYDELRYIQRVIDARWKNHEQNNAGDLDSKETILQQHAQAFFRGKATYLPRP